MSDGDGLLSLSERMLRLAPDAATPHNLCSDVLIGRFPRAQRREIRRLVQTYPRTADLLHTFPGVLSSLAQKRGSTIRRTAAVALIDSGAQLKSVARALDIPMWMRRLPPEAFELPLLTALPRSERFGRRIATRIPQANNQAAFWLAAILFAERAVHEDFALWLAGQPIYIDGGEADRLLCVLAAYVWFSSAPQTEGFRLIGVPWRPEVSFETAICAAKSWFNRIRLVLQLPTGTLTDAWLMPGSAQSYSFEPLLDSHEILAEAAAMQNCADQYAERVARNRCRLFSVRRNGQRVATMEIAQHPREACVLSILQLKARHNMAASTDIWQAAYAWMAQQQCLKRIPTLASEGFTPTYDQDAWCRIFSPYRSAKAGAPWVTATADEALFADQATEMADLAHRGGVTSWLFT